MKKEIEENKPSDRRRRQLQEIPKHSSKKDTKRWCRGKVGVEHMPKLMGWMETKNYDPINKWDLKVWICESCKKHLRYE